MNKQEIEERLDDVNVTATSMYIGQAKLSERDNIIEHISAIREYIKEQDAIKTELYEACKRAVRFINNGMEFGYISMPEKPDSAIDTLPKLKVIIEKVEADNGL